MIGTFSETSVAAKAGLKAGDRIVTVDGKPVDNWDQFANAILPKAKRDVNLGFIRDGQAGQVTVVPEGQSKYELGDIGIQPVGASAGAWTSVRALPPPRPACRTATSSWPPATRRTSRTPS